MQSVTTARFRKAFSKLPIHIQEAAKRNYRLWKNEPYHPSLQFKQIQVKNPVFSIRIGLAWRSLGVKESDTMIWFWIGSHEDYNNMINQL